MGIDWIFHRIDDFQIKTSIIVFNNVCDFYPFLVCITFMDDALFRINKSFFCGKKSQLLLDA